ncbi:Eco57I restriction-modification methylase domain-containing protein [Aureibacillus halotolerans]|uniref:site-specific DNA-methyltransferase (adenine-specific) n=1 Tax=Aureibacillus halotolerans TaxID=1508390 RepID=A0A4R6TYU8_9BACI|nr:Eco57I restriction-modification methylase domain-containing protein [Aureibacillus halotolerans]TDQ37135.1 adenine-specific DNA-methyltransferase [Aureibacillus halotolerans]
MSTLASYAERAAVVLNQDTSRSNKKNKGQYFSSLHLAKKMAGFVVLENGHLKVLDPGSGNGILIAALCDRIIEESLAVHLIVDVYELDTALTSALDQTLTLCQQAMESRGLSFSYRIYTEDFILHNKHAVSQHVKSLNYDLVISNPPYFKVKKDHPYVEIMSDYVFGQANVYFMFMALAEKMTRKHGQVLFVTPRSYCSGVYFKKFRQLFFAAIDPLQFHLFTSRKKIFVDEKVLQETVIFSGIKRESTMTPVKISSSFDPYDKQKHAPIRLLKSVLFQEKNFALKLPTSQRELEVLNMFSGWTNSLHEMDLSISTGPVVTFRHRAYIQPFSFTETAPLLYMRHIKESMVSFNETECNEGVALDSASDKLLLAASNFILIKRFSAKEQKKRIVCSSYIAKHFPYKKISMENHVNYIYKMNGELSEEETLGLAAFLSSMTFDIYFRMNNGNTQVNASDLRAIPLPDEWFLRDIGVKLLNGEVDYTDIDILIYRTYDKVLEEIEVK